MNEVEETDQPIEIKKAPTAAPPEKIVNIAPPRKPEGGNSGEMTATSSAGLEKSVHTFVYALGRVVPRFPSPGWRKSSVGLQE